MYPNYRNDRISAGYLVEKDVKARDEIDNIIRNTNRLLKISEISTTIKTKFGYIHKNQIPSAIVAVAMTISPLLGLNDQPKIDFPKSREPVEIVQKTSYPSSGPQKHGARGQNAPAGMHKRTLSKSEVFEKLQSEPSLQVSSRGGDITHPWSPGVRMGGKSVRKSNPSTVSRGTRGIRNSKGRRLLQAPGSRFTSIGKRLPGSHAFNPVEMNRPSGKGRIRFPKKMFVAKEDNDEISRDGDEIVTNSPKTTSEVDIDNTAKITKERSALTVMKDNKVVDDGTKTETFKLVDSVERKVTPQGRRFIRKTSERRSDILIQSRYENKENEFKPAYNPTQTNKKDKHTVEILKDKPADVDIIKGMPMDLATYNKLAASKQRLFDIELAENLLGHSESLLYPNAMGQGREPIFVVMNRGEGNYSLRGHVATFERRNEVFDQNNFITQYVLNKNQIKNFDGSNSTEIPYQDLLGNSHINIGPVFGKDSTTNASTTNPLPSDAPTPSPKVNNKDDNSL